ncbi:MAG: NAD-glutamate dehydrogenase [Deltaproteobacteria bacterium]|nr:NAD-glutamate dehydrogenase [Deltaproteobacteria bacterium]
MKDDSCTAFYGEQVQEKLIALHNHIAKSFSRENVKKNLDLKEDLSNILFRRAPEDFLEYRSVVTLGLIADEASAVFEQFINGTDPYRLEAQSFPTDNERATVTAFLVAMLDRPFVVDTITSLFATYNCHPRVMLHPIVTTEHGQQVSVVYLEVDAIESQATLDEIISSLHYAIRDLLAITDDYSTMTSRTEALAKSLEEKNPHARALKGDAKEISELLNWLVNGGFVFLGYRQWRANAPRLDNDGECFAEVLRAEDLGLFHSTNILTSSSLDDLTEDANFILNKQVIMTFAKTLHKSPIRRSDRMNILLIKTYSADGSAIVIHGLLGRLTSRTATMESETIPVIRHKLEEIIDLEGMLPNSHDYKEVLSIFDSTPKYELLQFNVEAIRQNVNIILGIPPRGETKINFYRDAMNRSISLMVVMPEERFVGGVHIKIRDFIESSLGIEPKSTEYRFAKTEGALARIHYFIPNTHNANLAIDRLAWQREIAELTLTWDDRLFSLLRAASSEQRKVDAGQLAAFYSKAFPQHYKAITSPEEAFFDIGVLESLSNENALQLALRHPAREDKAEYSDLKVFKFGGGLTISSTVPYLENAGLEIQHETSTIIKKKNSVWAEIYIFRIRAKSSPESLNDERIINDIFLPGLTEVLLERAENDALNQLMLVPGLSISEVALLRALKRYIRQINAFATMRSIIGALESNPDLVKLLVAYFHAKFDPNADYACQAERLTRLEKISASFERKLKEVSLFAHDRVLRSLLNVLQATVRTNFYHTDSDKRIALKIECKKVEQMPKPRPLYEVFISAPDFEGVHLRGGKIARGGIRWSERPDDYRTEVLGLMKTQMVKNAVIIPVGAKGGFIVKNQPTTFEAVKNCYRRFVQCLLQITDNISDGRVQHPASLVVYDQDDPYLVVAADKGTATFSDLANEIATKDFNFWLSDAFASGGSYGYDHKKLGITARGAWEAVKHHFREINLDYNSNTFTVVGIGDMSGDVFGNGLILSKNAKLLAAFDHRHIFIDPNPDSEASFDERMRLFKLPKSSWQDYDQSLISKGGGVFDRNDKEIRLSKKAQVALGVSAEALPGHELVQAILKAPVDLLWNGGIGTYVKASFEDNAKVGDRTNDDCRVSASDLRAKVIGEGGNLGFTQLARIEYSKLGGHLNTDAVDNSGGVNCSDLEVNLKILLQLPLKRGELSFEDRNALLTSLSEEVCEKVVNRNRLQSEILSLEVPRSRKHLEQYKDLIDYLENNGPLKRETEYLPDYEELEKRAQSKKGLTRPELAILMAYVKMALYDSILASNLPDNDFLQKHLAAYFPAEINRRFPADVSKHPLCREIIARQVSNVLVERMGITFVLRLTQEFASSVADIICAYLLATEVIEQSGFLDELDDLKKSHGDVRAQSKASVALTLAVEGMTRWFLQNGLTNGLSCTECAASYAEAFQLLMESTSGILSAGDKLRYDETVAQFLSSGFPQKLASMTTCLYYAVAYLDAIKIASSTALPPLSVAALYGSLVAEFQIPFLLEAASKLDSADKWDALAIRSVTTQLRSNVCLLVKDVIRQTGCASGEAISSYLANRSKLVTHYKKTIAEFRISTNSLASLLVIANELSAIATREVMA